MRIQLLLRIELLLLLLFGATALLLLELRLLSLFGQLFLLASLL
jgi:hypothetical protein